MDFHFGLPGPPDLDPLERSFLLADGRGGAAQLSLAGLATRAWHAAYAPDPAFGTSVRWVSPGLGLEQQGRAAWLPEQAESFARRPDAALFESFDQDPLPRTIYRLGEARLELLLAAQHGEPAMLLRVRVFGARAGSRLLFRPAFGVMDTASVDLPLLQAVESPHSRSVRRSGEEGALEMLHPEAEILSGPAWDRARRVSGFWFRPVTLALSLPAGESVREFRVAPEGTPFAEGGAVLSGEQRRLRSMPPVPRAEAPGGERLPASLERFRALDRSGRPVLLARLPRLGPEDDDPGAAMRALPQVLLAFERFDPSREMLADAAHRIHAAVVSSRAMHEPGKAGARSEPREPGDPAAPADLAGEEAPLEWVLAGYRHALAGEDFAFAASELWPVWMELMHRVREGRDPTARLRADGLLEGLQDLPAASAAEERRASELQLQWYVALEVFARCAARAGHPEEQGGFERQATAARAALRAAFAASEAAALVSARAAGGAPARLSEPAMDALTVLLLALPFPALDLEPRQARLEAVRRQLWTPVGLRLRPASEEASSEDLSRAVLPSLLGPWGEAERRARQDAAALAARAGRAPAAPPAVATAAELTRSREAVGPRLEARVLGHACPVLSPLFPYGPHPALDPVQLERADLESDSALLSLFRSHG